ncbi:MAG: aspartyl-tRNA(Asn)/glutamyl-tRNA(Gln) amidotransferase subunit [Pseudonocardiales bacterium]|nr:aspartyl-tRNA(Asn)/glutamyl-tRNA(Gln) amidotransferase subunit [Pseudonocardiales bacterium]
MEPVHPESASALALSTAPAITRLSAGQIAELIARDELCAEEVVAAHLHHIADVDRTLRALVSCNGERALGEARRIDRDRRLGGAVGPLAGVPFVVKDNIDVRRQTTSSGSRAHANVVALRDALVVRRLRAAGAVLLGRANMDELAMGASTQTSAFGATRNPWDVRRSPGGSSGGSAAAVAAGLATVSVGSDTGGSIREPAAQCGVVGMAPSPGLVPVAGVVPFAPDLDRVGPLTRSVADSARLLAVLSGRPDLAVLSQRAVHQLRVGVVEELSGSANQPGVLARLQVVRHALRRLGVEIISVSVPDSPRALGAYMKITSAACVPLLEPYVRTGQAGDEVVRRWQIGRALLGPGGADELADAFAVQQRLAEQTRSLFGQCDVLLSPTMPTTAPLLRDETADLADSSAAELADPMAAPYTDCWTVVANLAGLPSLSLPAGRCAFDGMPVGVMLCGRRGSDRDLLDLGAALEACDLTDS